MATSVFHCFFMFFPSKSSLVLAQPLVLPFEDAHLPRGFFAENERPHRDRLAGRDDRCGYIIASKNRDPPMCLVHLFENMVVSAFY